MKPISPINIECPWCDHQANFIHHMIHIEREHPTFFEKYNRENSRLLTHEIPDREAEDIIEEAKSKLNRIERRVEEIDSN